MKIVVCGSRTFTDYKRLEKVLMEIHFGLFAFGESKTRITSIVAGEARGADLLAKEFAARHHFAYQGFPARWEQEGRSAGFNRNVRMIDERPDLVVAFWDGKSRGTAHTIELAQRAGINTQVERF